MLYQELDEQTRKAVLNTLKAFAKNDKKPLGEENSISLYDLKGVGAHVWNEVNPNEYVRRLRNEWDDRDSSGKQIQ